jgi:flavin-dependent dehydrogenase
MNISRSEFDAWLCRSSGAAILDQCRFIGLEDLGGEILLKVKQNREECEIITNYLVGADGTLSRVRKALDPDFDQGIGLLPNYEEWYTGEIDLEPQWLYQFFDRKVTGFFACVFHKDDQIIVTTGCQVKEAVKDLFQAFVTHLKQRHGLKIQKTNERYACVIHDMSGTNNYFPGQSNVLLVGEAAGLNRCAEGITSALISGRAAGEAILQGTTARQPIDIYSKSVELEIKKCNKAIHVVEKAIGINPFTRD